MSACDDSVDIDINGERLRELLKPYAASDTYRATLEVASTAIPFAVLIAAMIYGVRHAPWLTVLLYVPLAGAIVRLFVLQHDCGHRSLFPSAGLNDWVGRAISLVTLTPYAYWRGQHAAHHASSGNLDRRGVGDIPLLTVREFASRTPAGRLRYRIYRHPLVLFVIAPTIQYWLIYRIPTGGPLRHSSDWSSIVGTDAALAVLYAAIALTVGMPTFALAFFPSAVLAASAGVWLFYVQHHFPQTVWDGDADWDYQRAALLGSSLYDLPKPLHWLTINIGFHHLHHLWSRIPSYNLQRCFAEVPEMQSAARLSLRESMRCMRLLLWDEERRRLTTIRDAAQRSDGRS
jgi:acyl-lipid omega-6 desaturase (Delta-12 desaturase)